MTITERRRSLVTGGDPDKLYQVPAPGTFVDRAGFETEFILAHDLEEIVAALIRVHDLRFQHFHDLRIAIRWKRSGGKSSGKRTFGKCVRAAGLLAHFSEMDFVIWLAADHCREANFTAYQVEALLYRQMLHIAVDDDGEVVLAPPDFSGFRSEVEEYGDWQPDLSGARRAFDQLRLSLG